MLYIRIICIIIVLIGFFLSYFISYVSRKNFNIPKAINKNHNFCVLIPARYESNTISGLLKSIKNQSYKIPMKDVYVIIESIKDKTRNICMEYGTSLIVRKKLHLKSKGYALDEAVTEILSKNKKYDAYFIFDADNILDKDYFKNMIPTFDKGYDIASGYRNCKNGNDSVIAACSSLIFSLVNTVFNDKKCHSTKNITLSGTGFYIRGYLIEKWGCFPFHSLTEDYELSCYAILNNLTTYYESNAIFYDEQPVTYKQTVAQRIRWIKGYFNVRKKYAKKIGEKIISDNVNKGSKIDGTFGVIPYIIIIIGFGIWLLGLFFNFIYNLIVGLPVLHILLEILIITLLVYLILMLITLFIIIKERKKIDISNSMKIKTLLFNPIFLSSYVYCALKALLKKEVTWTKIEHGIKKE